MTDLCLIYLLLVKPDTHILINEIMLIIAINLQTYYRPRGPCTLGTAAGMRLKTFHKYLHHTNFKNGHRNSVLV